MKAIVVGAGPGGLLSAQLLQKGGVDITLLEAGDAVGGRVRSDVVDGFTLDRGFQVLFTAYPAAKRQLDYDALDLRTFDPGAIVLLGARRFVLTDPFRDLSGAVPAMIAPVISPLDKLRTVLLSTQLRLQSVDDVISGRDETTLQFLKRRGFSNAYVNRFIRPFYGGIFQDRSLKTSAKCFKFDFKMLSDGSVVVPGGGMGKITEQLAEPLVKEGRVRLNARVQSLLRGEHGAVTGVLLADGTELTADVVVLSVPAPEAARLTNLDMPKGAVGTVNLYWHGDTPLYKEKKLALNANPRPFISNIMQMTNVAPEYAPDGRHLLSATVVGAPDGDDEQLFRMGMDDLRLMFRGDLAALHALDDYKPLAIYRIPYGQFAQPPGIHPHLPDNVSGIPNLYFASELTEASSINAAMISAEKCAEVLLSVRDRIAA